MNQPIETADSSGSNDRSPAATVGMVEQRYYDGTYLEHNPDWDRADSPWKARNVHSILEDFGISPASICEIGCGAGDILVRMREFYSEAMITGFDISPDAAGFWQAHSAHGIQFRLGDFLEINREHYDAVLVLDVIEHLADPFSFLEGIRDSGKHFVFHFPLDLSALNVLRESRILQTRRDVGHVHYFTKGLALALLRDAGFVVTHWRYTGASLTGPSRTLKTGFASIPRRLAGLLGKDFGVRLLGGETLMVLATSA